MRFRTWKLLPLCVISFAVVLAHSTDVSKAAVTNQAPVLNPDSYDVHGTFLKTAPGVLANDSDPDGDQLSLINTGSTNFPGIGTAYTYYNGQVYFAPSSGSGTAVVTYQVTDNHGHTPTSTVTFNVHNNPPVGVVDVFEVKDGSFVSKPGEGVLANDFDPDGDTLHSFYQSWAPVYDPAGHWEGQYELSTDGSGGVTFSGIANYSGVLIGGYQVSDSLGSTVWGTIVFVMESSNNNGYSCPLSKGKPVNVSTGNMWLHEVDYSLPGTGENINVDRFYNSANQSTGLFGFGWTTAYDVSLTSSDGRLLRLNKSDGSATYFFRTNTTDPFVSIRSDVQGQIVQNVDGTYTLTFKDGRIHQFSSAGKLLWQKDRNGNQTTLSYNGSGQLTGITDAFGRTLTVTPNSNGTVASISDALGTVATYAYCTGTTRLQTVTFQDGSKYKFEYDTTSASGKVLLKTVKDAYDNILETHLYDSSARATSSEVQGGVEKYTFDYTNTTSGTDPYTIVTDGLGRVSKYHFDRSRIRYVVTKVEGICGCGGGGSEVTTYVYDPKLNLKSKADALGHQTTYQYDSNLNLTKITDPLGVQQFTYNSFGEVLTATDRMNGVWTNTYSATGNLLTAKDPLNNTTTLTYTTPGQLATVTDALNHTTTLSYDTSGRLSQVTDANNKNTNFGYDGRSRLTSTTDALSEVTSYDYDGRDRLTKVTYPDTNFVTYTYDLAGRRTGYTDARNNTTTYGYDGAYRLTNITDPLSHTTSFGYDLMSNMTSQTDALSNPTNYTYDDFNRLTKITYPAASVGATRLEENLTYDLNSNVKTKVDTAGRTTTYDYDTANRLIKITDALTNITQFEYNARSQMTKVTDALSQQYQFTYDPLGRVLTQTRAGSTMSFVYDAVGNRTQRTDYKGQVTDYAYDVLNRLTTITYNGTPSTQATYAYDDLSRLVSAVNGAGTVGLTYDNRNRLKTETDVFGHVVEYGYDATSNRTQLKLDGNVQTGYAYDVANRLTTLTDEATQNFTFGYDNANKLISRVMPNGITTTYDYDGMSRLTRLKDVNTSATLFDRQYTYNTANQISQITDLTETRNFGYDNVDRLTSQTGSIFGNESYSFDGVGNRTASHRSATYGYQSNNRLTSTATATYGYDANGVMTSKTDGSTNWTYTWDFENRMVSANNGTGHVDYAYDALGRRVSRDDGTQLTNFTYDGQDVVMDDDSVSGISTYQNGLAIDNKLKISNSTAASYFLADHLGSTNALTDPSGSVTASNSYDSFGNGANISFPSRYQFTGRELDSFTGLQFNRARWYDAAIGRFISEDPIGFKGRQLGLYAYVENNPIQRKDPTGMIDPSVYQDPGMYKGDPRKLACDLDGYNPWLTGEFGGALQFGPLGGADSIVIAFNPLTFEVVGFTKLMSGNGGSVGILATAGAQLGVTFGSAEGSRGEGTAAEVFGDASAFGGGSGSISLLGDLGGGIGVGPTIGGGAAGGLRIGESTLLFSVNPNKCSCTH